MTAVTLFVVPNSQDVVLACEGCKGMVRVVGGAGRDYPLMEACDTHVTMCQGKPLAAQLAGVGVVAA